MRVRSGWHRHVQVLVVVALLCLLLVPSCAPKPEGATSGGTVEEPKYTLIWSIARTPEYPVAVGAHEFEEKIEAATDNRVDLKIFDSATLFAIADTASAILDGSIDIGWTAAFYFDSYDPKWNVVSVPYLWANEEHFEAFINETGPGQDLMKRWEAKGFKFLTWTGSCGYDCLWNKTKVIRNIPEDGEGLKIRVAPGAIRERYASLMGVSAVAMTVPEVLTGLEQGTVDGVITRMQVGIRSYKTPETCPYVTDDPRFDIIPCLQIANADKWSKLPQDIQEQLEGAFLECGAYTAELYAKEINEMWARYTSVAGNTRTILTDSESEAWESVLMEPVMNLCRTDYGAAAEVEAAVALSDKF